MTEANLIRTILYIEDDPASRRLVQRSLKHAGYEVLLAERGLQGIDIARTQKPDLVLTDINLPDISGYEIATSLRNDERFAALPIVALTAHGYGEPQHIAAAAGINGYLTKPLNLSYLIRQIEFYISGGVDQIDRERVSAAQVRYTRDVVSRLEQQVRQLEDANTRLRTLDRMKENFIQITAHELRTPLTLVIGYSRLLEDYPPLKALIEHDVSISTLLDGLRDSITRMYIVIDEILTMSRIMMNEIDLSLAPISLGNIVQRVNASFYETLAERDLTIHLEPDEWPKQMQGDADLLKLAFTNLIGNAIKFTPDGGDIFLNARICEGNPAPCVIVKVRDTGIGIDPADQEDIFEEFHTLGDVEYHSTSKTAFGGGGLGLGLPVSRGIIEAHGGSVSVESRGRDTKNFPGSTFIINLPIIAQRKDKASS